MQKARSVQYVTAGLQEAASMPMQVRGNVTLPDSEAGRFYEADRQPYRAVNPAKRPRFTGEIPLTHAAVLLCALFVLVGFLLVGKAVKRAELSKKIDDMNISIQATEDENAILAQEVEEARSFRRISDLATSQFDMFDSKKVKPQMVTAPSTRPMEDKTTVQADASPYSALDGMISGSR